MRPENDKSNGKLEKIKWESCISVVESLDKKTPYPAKLHNLNYITYFCGIDSYGNLRTGCSSR